MMGDKIFSKSCRDSTMEIFSFLKANTIYINVPTIIEKEKWIGNNRGQWSQ